MAVKTLTIQSGQNVSDTLSLLDAGHLAGIFLPTGWTAADLTFDASWDYGGNFYPVVDYATNAEIIVKGGVNLAIMIPPTLAIGAAFLRIRSGTHSVGVNQVATREIRVVTKEYG